MTDTVKRPELDTVAPYYRSYIQLVEEDDLLLALRASNIRARDLLRSIPEDRGTHRYEAGKWSIKQIVAHLVDTERILSYRALCFSRGEREPLPGYEEDAYVAESEADRRSLAALNAELELARASTIALFAGMSEPQLDRRGVANGVESDARSYGFILAGHEAHHLTVIRQRYL